MKALRIIAVLAVLASVLMLGGCTPQAEGTEGTSLATNTPAVPAPATNAPATNEAPATNAPATNEAASTNAPEASTNSK